MSSSQALFQVWAYSFKKSNASFSEQLQKAASLHSSLKLQKIKSFQSQHLNRVYNQPSGFVPRTNWVDSPLFRPAGVFTNAMTLYIVFFATESHTNWEDPHTSSVV
eukprot:scpid83186/ scgid30002/ 